LNGNDRVDLAMNDRGPDIELFLRVLVKSVSETPTAVSLIEGSISSVWRPRTGCASEAIMLLGISYVEFGYRRSWPVGGISPMAATKIATFAGDSSVKRGYTML
jgi:hypothetical protein